jgi:hypothetical protein
MPVSLCKIKVVESQFQAALHGLRKRVDAKPQAFVRLRNNAVSRKPSERQVRFDVNIIKVYLGKGMCVTRTEP